MARYSFSFAGPLAWIGLALALAGCTSTPPPRGTAPIADETVGASSIAGVDRSPDLFGRTPKRVVALRAEESRNAYVLLSGGGTPLSNNYSQYLQARAIAAFFERECPPESTWIFFGAGNRDDAPPVLGDTRRELKRDGLLVQSWLPGTLKGNRPATRDSFLRALRDEILPTVRGGGTLYLLVGDHGELDGEGDARESAITLWQMKRTRRRSGGWFTDEKEVLGVAELRKALADGLGQGRVVFGMTQCHGGGFHELGVSREMLPPREWFATAPPAWAAGKGAGVHLRVAGFTATDEASLAAGCDADPDPERWAGYERFLPESLLGIDLMTGQPKGSGSRSLMEAHEAATLVDRTIDKPRSSSEHYLEAWARLIETKLLSAPNLSAATQRAVTAFQRAVNEGVALPADEDFRARQAQFAGFTRALAEQAPAASELLRRGTREQLSAAIRARGERGPGRGNRRASGGELRRAWSEVLRPAWKAAVLAGQVAGLSAVTLAFEQELLKAEDGGKDFFLARGGGNDAMLNELYWGSSYAEPANFDRAKAEAVTRWGAERRSWIVAWAKTAPMAAVREAAEKIGPGAALVEEPPRPLSRRTAAERVLFYRRVLAAWEFLESMQAMRPLAELQALIEIERTPWRATTVATKPASAAGQ